MGKKACFFSTSAYFSCLFHNLMYFLFFFLSATQQSNTPTPLFNFYQVKFSLTSFFFASVLALETRFFNQKHSFSPSCSHCLIINPHKTLIFFRPAIPKHRIINHEKWTLRKTFIFLSPCDSSSWLSPLSFE